MNKMYCCNKNKSILDKFKDIKIKELKRKRDEYKKFMGFSKYEFENIEFKLVDDYKLKNTYWRDFLKDLIKKFDYYEYMINNAKSKEELDSIEIEFFTLKKFIKK